MWKLRPLTDRLNSNFKRHFVPEQHVSYDESMIAYYGRHGCKQFIRIDNNVVTMASTLSAEEPKDRASRFSRAAHARIVVAPNAEVQYDGFRHYVEVCNRRYCANENCKGNIRTQCGKCNVGLCVKCFEPYHSAPRSCRE